MNRRTKEFLPEPLTFVWDEGNSDKNWIRHHVAQIECEAIFFNDPLCVRTDLLHSQAENRFVCLGKTQQNRHLFVSFTIRKNEIRIISARDMTRREFQEYRKHEKENS